MRVQSLVNALPNTASGLLDMAYLSGIRHHASRELDAGEAG